MAGPTDAPRPWCKTHLDHHRGHIDRRRPVNDMLLVQEMGSAWHRRLRTELGTDTPTDPAVLAARLEADLPLCCHLGDDVMAELRRRCVLPPEYRMMPPAAAQRLHLLAVMSRGGRVHAEH